MNEHRHRTAFQGIRRALALTALSLGCSGLVVTVARTDPPGPQSPPATREADARVVGAWVVGADLRTLHLVEISIDGGMAAISHVVLPDVASRLYWEEFVAVGSLEERLRWVTVRSSVVPQRVRFGERMLQHRRAIGRGALLLVGDRKSRDEGSASGARRAVFRSGAASWSAPGEPPSLASGVSWATMDADAVPEGPAQGVLRTLLDALPSPADAEVEANGREPPSADGTRVARDLVQRLYAGAGGNPELSAMAIRALAWLGMSGSIGSAVLKSESAPVRESAVYGFGIDRSRGQTVELVQTLIARESSASVLWACYFELARLSDTERLDGGQADAVARSLPRDLEVPLIRIASVLGRSGSRVALEWVLQRVMALGTELPAKLSEEAADMIDIGRSGHWADAGERTIVLDAWRRTQAGSRLLKWSGSRGKFCASDD